MTNCLGKLFPKIEIMSRNIKKGVKKMSFPKILIDRRPRVLKVVNFICLDFLAE